MCYTMHPWLAKLLHARHEEVYMIIAGRPSHSRESSSPFRVLTAMPGVHSALPHVRSALCSLSSPRMETRPAWGSLWAVPRSKAVLEIGPTRPRMQC